MQQKPIIELGTLRGEQAVLKVSVEIALRQHTTAVAELRAYDEKTAKKIREALANGHTTGDEFSDKALTLTGTDFTAYDKLKAFNDLLVNSAGKEILLAFEYSESFDMSDPPSRHDAPDQRRYASVVGILSGESLEIQGEGGLSISFILPLRRYVTFRMELEGGPFEGKLTLPEHWSRNYGYKLYEAIVTEGQSTRMPDRELGKEAAFIIAPDLSAAKMPSGGVLEEVWREAQWYRKHVLYKATESEKFMAEGI